jgi:hypothetical protein
MAIRAVEEHLDGGRGMVCTAEEFSSLATVRARDKYGMWWKENHPKTALRAQYEWFRPAGQNVRSCKKADF